MLVAMMVMLMLLMTIMIMTMMTMLMLLKNIAQNENEDEKFFVVEKLGVLMTTAMIKDKEKSELKMVQLLYGEDKVEILMNQQIAIKFYN